MGKDAYADKARGVQMLRLAQEEGGKVWKMLTVADKEGLGGWGKVWKPPMFG